MDTATIVTMNERTTIRHEHNFRCGSVTLVFLDDGELAMTCDAATLDRLARVVDAAARDLAGRNHAEPSHDVTNGCPATAPDDPT